MLKGLLIGTLIGSMLLCCGSCGLSWLTPDETPAPVEAEEADGNATLFIYLTEEAKDSQDWRIIRDTINYDTEVIVVESNDDVPQYNGGLKAWIGRWDADPSYLLHVGDNVRYDAFMELSEGGKPFILWSEGSD